MARQLLYIMRMCSCTMITSMQYGSTSHGMYELDEKIIGEKFGPVIAGPAGTHVNSISYKYVKVRYWSLHSREQIISDMFLSQ